jgi:hypothetical protein
MEHKNKEGKIEPVIKAYDCERMKWIALALVASIPKLMEHGS